MNRWTLVSSCLAVAALAIPHAAVAQPATTTARPTAARPRPTKKPVVNNPCDMDRVFGEVLATGDLDALLELYEPKATLVVEPGKPASGTAAIRAGLAGFVALKGKFTIDTKHCIVSGDLALLRASWRLDGTGPDGKPMELTGQSAEVVRRQANGTWRYAIDYPEGSSPLPPAAAPKGG